MKLGTRVKINDGRIGTVVFNGLIGVGIKWGIHSPKEEDFEGTSGNTVDCDIPDDFQWEPEALLREPWNSCEKYGFKPEECVGNNYIIIDE